MSIKRAGDVNVGDVLVTETGNHRVTGWYVNGRGRMVLEYADRWHTHSPNEQLTLATTKDRT